MSQTVRAQTIYEKIDSYVYVFPFSLNTKNSDCVMSAEGRQKEPLVHGLLFATRGMFGLSRSAWV